MLAVINALVILRSRVGGVMRVRIRTCGGGHGGQRRIHVAHSPCPGPRRQDEDYGEQAGNGFSRSHHCYKASSFDCRAQLTRLSIGPEVPQGSVCWRLLAPSEPKTYARP